MLVVEMDWFLSSEERTRSSHHDDGKAESIYVHVSIPDPGGLSFGLELRLATGQQLNSS